MKETLKKHTPILLIFFSSVCWAAEKPYESYDEIVNKLSKYRREQASAQMSVSVPREKFHVSFGLGNNSTRISNSQVGTVSQNGFVLGVAQPLISQLLFAEVFAKFYQDSKTESVTSELQQYELRISLKEQMSFALLNFGIGTAARFMSVQTPSLHNDYRIPSALATLGLERRFTSRLSIAGDVAFHRSLKEDSNGKNATELILRINYHL